jgi:hypothetical protein
MEQFILEILIGAQLVKKSTLFVKLKNNYYVPSLYTVVSHINLFRNLVSHFLTINFDGVLESLLSLPNDRSRLGFLLKFYVDFLSFNMWLILLHVHTS